MLDAIGRLETAVLQPKHQAGVVRVLGEILEIREAIARARQEVAKLRPPDGFGKELVGATEELDHIVEATETATSEILSAAEDIQEVAWTLRENGLEPALCDRLDKHAIDIYTACSFQDITGQRTDKVVRTLRLIEQRVEAMIKIWGADDLADTLVQALVPAVPVSPGADGPPPPGVGLKQEDVDETLASAPVPEAMPEPSEAPEPPEVSSGERFERPEPLTFSELHAVKRSALFG